MATHLNLLIVEDSAEDSALLVAALRSAGFEPNTKRVQTEADYLASLEDLPELIIADYRMPQFSGLRAIDLLRERGLDIPFLLVSGTVGEEQAVEAMKHGVTDYLLKDRLARLGKAVEGALKQKRLLDDRKHADEALRQSEARYRTLFDTLIEGFCTIEMIFDASGKPVDYRFLEINPAFERQTGLHNAQGRLMRDLAPNHEAHWFNIYGNIALTGEPARFENEAKALGRRYDVCAYRIGGPESRKVAILFNDVTERKQAEAALQRLANIVESSNDAIIGESLDAEVTSWNPAAERIFGYSAAEMIGQPVARLLPPDRLGEEPAILDRINRGEATIYLETRRLRKDGVQIDVAVTISPIKDTEGTIVGASKIGRDITLQKRQAAELEEVQKQLRETAVRIGRAEMARTVVHNIGNVLNGIGVSTTLIAQKIQNSKGLHIGKLAALLQQHEADLPSFLSTDPKGKKVPAFVADLAAKFADEQKALTSELQFVGEKVAHIRSIIDTHQASASVSGLTQQVTASELVEEALRLNAASLESRGVRVIRQFSETPPITTEKHKVLQILVNLITNAAQALEQGRQQDRQLICQIDSQDGQSVLISVADNGMGVSPENLPRIFQQGFTTRQGGHGLGLHGSALLARELGGDLTVTSNGPGQGAVFTLGLPLTPTPIEPRSADL